MALGEQDNSEIRDSERSDLIRRVSRRAYEDYLVSMNLAHLRSYRDAHIRFDFPVTALVGPNGGGKSTVLGAAALIHEDVKPRQYFAKSGVYDKSMVDWRIEYEILEKRKPISRTASYPKSKWNRNAIKRRILTFGVARTLPATERKDLASFIGGAFKGFGETVLSQETVTAVESILGKEAQKYLLVSGDKKGDKQLYAARTTGGDAYSEFHFGAGEASVIRIVRDIEESPDGSLIVIEEIENGLHPVATRRLVEYLIAVARRKSLQVIFTTHSNDALKPLPDEGVWACANGTLTQGKLDVNTLRTLTGEVNASFAIFVEDDFGASMALAAFREYARLTGVSMLGAEVHKLGGAGVVRKLTIAHNDNPSIAFKAMGIVDGDVPSEVDEERHVYAFPGTGDPELHVANAVADKLDSVAARLALNLGLRSSDQQRVADAVRSRILTNRDPHLVFEQIGEDLDFLGGEAVAHAFLTQWAENYPEEVVAIFGKATAVIPDHPGSLVEPPQEAAGPSDEVSRQESLRDE
jgi:AAA domain, putative AbiEii toxin, Type IV TA system